MFLDPGSFPEQPGQQAGDYGGDYDMVTISNSYIASGYILGVLVTLHVFSVTHWFVIT